jgi:hypothetical protein
VSFRHLLRHRNSASASVILILKSVCLRVNTTLLSAQNPPFFLIFSFEKFNAVNFFFYKVMMVSIFLVPQAASHLGASDSKNKKRILVSLSYFYTTFSYDSWHNFNVAHFWTAHWSRIVVPSSIFMVVSPTRRWSISLTTRWRLSISNLLHSQMIWSTVS